MNRAAAILLFVWLTFFLLAFQPRPIRYPTVAVTQSQTNRFLTAP